MTYSFFNFIFYFCFFLFFDTIITLRMFMGSGNPNYLPRRSSGKKKFRWCMSVNEILLGGVTRFWEIRAWEPEERQTVWQHAIQQSRCYINENIDKKHAHIQTHTLYKKYTHSHKHTHTGTYTHKKIKNTGFTFVQHFHHSIYPTRHCTNISSFCTKTGALKWPTHTTCVGKTGSPWREASALEGSTVPLSPSSATPSSSLPCVIQTLKNLHIVWWHAVFVILYEWTILFGGIYRVSS